MTFKYYFGCYVENGFDVAEEEMGRRVRSQCYKTTKTVVDETRKMVSGYGPG